MQTNGTISPAIIADQQNEYGELQSSSVIWGNAIECQVQTNTDNRVGKYEDGEFRMSAYTICIDVDTPYFEALSTEEDAIIATTEWDAIVINTKQFNFERVRLTRYDEYLGEFRVQQCDIFPRMGRIVIRVAQ